MVNDQLVAPYARHLNAFSSSEYERGGGEFLARLEKSSLGSHRCCLSCHVIKFGHVTSRFVTKKGLGNYHLSFINDPN